MCIVYLIQSIVLDHLYLTKQVKILPIDTSEVFWPLFLYFLEEIVRLEIRKVENKRALRQRKSKRKKL